MFGSVYIGWLFFYRVCRNFEEARINEEKPNGGICPIMTVELEDHILRFIDNDFLNAEAIYLILASLFLGATPHLSHIK